MNDLKKTKPEVVGLLVFSAFFFFFLLLLLLLLLFFFFWVFHCFFVNLKLQSLPAGCMLTPLPSPPSPHDTYTDDKGTKTEIFLISDAFSPFEVIQLGFVLARTMLICTGVLHSVEFGPKFQL